MNVVKYKKGERHTRKSAESLKLKELEKVYLSCATNKWKAASWRGLSFAYRKVSIWAAMISTVGHLGS